MNGMLFYVNGNFLKKFPSKFVLLVSSNILLLQHKLCCVH